MKSKGVKKGDRVAVYMPMILETVVVVLACARIGAVHSLVVNKLYTHTLGTIFVCWMMFYARKFYLKYAEYLSYKMGLNWIWGTNFYVGRKCV